MKSLIFAVATVAAFAMPLAAFSQTDTPVTRAQVQAELQQLEQNGYRLTGEDPYYPTNIQAAEARVGAANGATGYGGTSPVSSMSGSRGAAQPASPEALKQIYMGGQ